MRRFMQTFILAPQSPKKYYVHNDIFRYQDEVFHDLDGGVDSSAQQVTAELDGQDMQKGEFSSLSVCFVDFIA
jgi:Ras GTPase-activating protein-binding protein 1